MLCSYITKNLIGLQDVILKKVEQDETFIYIHVQMSRKAHTCPCCGKSTDKVHNYRKQYIKDIPAFGKLTYIVLLTNMISLFQLNNPYSISNFIILKHLFKILHFSLFFLYFCLFFTTKGFIINFGETMYQYPITDPVNKRVLDILYERYAHYLSSYFKSSPREKSNKVRYFVSDMWKTYFGTFSIWNMFLHQFLENKAAPPLHLRCGDNRFFCHVRFPSIARKFSHGIKSNIFYCIGTQIPIQ